LNTPCLMKSLIIIIKKYENLKIIKSYLKIQKAHYKKFHFKNN